MESFTEVYKQFTQHWDKDTRNKSTRGRPPFSFDELYIINSHQEYIETVECLKKRSRPCIEIAASSMCVSGSIVNYLKAFIEDKCADVLLVGYQIKGVSGGALQQYGSHHGYVELELKYIIHFLDGCMAHVDQKGLLDFVSCIDKSVCYAEVDRLGVAWCSY